MGKNSDIRIKTHEELILMREAGKILARILADLKSSLKIGMTTKEIDERAESLMKDCGVAPAFKGYHGYPACLCLSVNEEVIHGIPGARVIKDGDIVGIDIGIIRQGYYSDMAFTVGFGDVPPAKQKLMDVTRQALLKGIAEARPGNRLGDISNAIQRYAESKGFSIVRDFVGHGIGRALHEDPEIPNYCPPRQGPLLKAGMVFAIEPMVNMGSWAVVQDADRWTIRTADGQPSAHFEHTIVVTKGEPLVLTLP